MREELQRIINEVENERDPKWMPTDEMSESYSIHAHYFVRRHGIQDTVRFLASNGKSTEEIEKYLVSGLKTSRDWRKYLKVRTARQVHVAVKIENSFNTTVTAPANEELPPRTEAEDTDPHRFTYVDVLALAEKIEKHGAWPISFKLASDYLREQGQGPITPTMVAFVGCLWRRNIRAQKRGVEPGAVPFEAATKFFKHGNALLGQLVKCPTNRQLKACLGVLEAIGFLKRCRPPITRQQSRTEGKPSRCATYKLLNEEAWQ